jgi:hypothetical protein
MLPHRRLHFRSSGESGGYTSDGNTKLLLHFDGSDQTFTDSSSNNYTVTAQGNATQSSAKSKYGGKSLYLPGGTGDYITTAGAAWILGTGDFTVEAWVWIVSLTPAPVIGETRQPWNVYVIYIASDGKLSLYNGTAYASTSAVGTGAWHHVAWVRSSGTLMFFIDGVKDASTHSVSADLTSANTSADVRIGSAVDPHYTSAYYDELRVSDVARWTSDFTP